MDPVSFTSRDIRKVREDIIEYIKSKNIGWTDFSQSDIGMVLIDVMSGVADMLNYYIDTQSREAFLMLATEAKNIRGILDAYSYPYRMVGSAQAQVTFTAIRDEVFSSSKGVNIPLWTRVSTSSTDGTDQINYLTTEAARILPGTDSVTVPVMEGNMEDITVTGSMLSHSYKFDLGVLNIPKNGVRIIQGNGEWTRVDDAFTELNGGKLFSVHYTPKGTAYILFSYDWRNYLPKNLEEEITIRYVVSRGTSGNVGAEELTEFQGPIFDDDGYNCETYLTVTNTSQSYGAEDEEDWIQAKANAKNYIRSMGRAVTLADYEGLVLANPNICQAYLADKRTNKKLVPAYYQVKAWVVPNEGELADETLSNIIDPIQKEIDASCDVIVDFKVEQAEFVTRDIDIACVLLTSDTTQMEEVRQIVQNAVVEWGSYKTLKMGSNVYRSNLINFIQGLDPRIDKVVIVGFDDNIYCQPNQVPYVRVKSCETATQEEYEEIMASITDNDEKVVSEKIVTIDRGILSTEDVLSAEPSINEMRTALKTLWRNAKGTIAATCLAVMASITAFGATDVTEGVMPPGTTTDSHIFSTTPIVTNAWEAVKSNVTYKLRFYDCDNGVRLGPASMLGYFQPGSILLDGVASYPSSVGEGFAGTQNGSFNISIGFDNQVGFGEGTPRYATAIGTSAKAKFMHSYAWGSQINALAANSTVLGYGGTTTSQWSTVIGHGRRPWSDLSFTTTDLMEAYYMSKGNPMWVGQTVTIGSQVGMSADYIVEQVLEDPNSATGMYVILGTKPMDYQFSSKDWRYGKDHGVGTFNIVAWSPTDTSSRGLKAVYINDDSLFDLVMEQAGGGQVIKKGLPLTESQLNRGITYVSDGYEENGAVEIGTDAESCIKDSAVRTLTTANTKLRNVAVAVGTRAVAEGSSPIKNQSIAIGYSAHAKGSCAIAIGPGAKHFEGEDDLTGHNAYANGSTALAIGYATKALSTGATAIGAGVSGGNKTVASGTGSVAIGQAAQATAVGSVQLGTGVNDEPNTLKFQGVTIVKNGKVVGSDTNLQDRVEALESERAGIRLNVTDGLLLEGYGYRDGEEDVRFQFGTSTNGEMRMWFGSPGFNPDKADPFQQTVLYKGETIDAMTNDIWQAMYSLADAVFSGGSGGTTPVSGDYVPFVADAVGNLTAVTIGSRDTYNERVGESSLTVGQYNMATYNGAVALGDGAYANGYSAFAVGSMATAGADRSIAMGNDCEVQSGHTGTFIWSSGNSLNGYARTGPTTNRVNRAAPVAEGTVYMDHGAGSFNIDPVGGIDGVWIGELSLRQHMEEVINSTRSVPRTSVPTLVDGNKYTCTSTALTEISLAELNGDTLYIDLKLGYGEVFIDSTMTLAKAVKVKAASGRTLWRGKKFITKLPAIVSAKVVKPGTTLITIDECEEE